MQLRAQVHCARSFASVRMPPKTQCACLLANKYYPLYTLLRWDDPAAIQASSRGRPLTQGEIFMSWLFLLLAGLLETVWAVGLKYTQGFTQLWPSVITLVAMAGSIWLLSIAMKVLPLGTAYAVWTGIGAIGTVIIGIVVFAEPTSWPRLCSVALIFAGLVGLKVFTPS